MITATPLALALVSSFLLTILAVPTNEDPAANSSSLAELWTFDQLREQFDDPQVRILDARPRDDYLADHIPGAVWVDHRAAEQLAATPDGLSNVQAWKEWIAPLGIGPETRIVIYDAHRQLNAARIWWLLTYLGAKHVALVDGGYPLWKSAGNPTSEAIPTVAPRDFPIELQADRLATREYVLALERADQVLDARSAPEFNGVEVRSKRGGHIPAACHVEWKQLVNESGQFLSLADARILLERAGIRPGAPVVTHCQGGGRASVNAFVLERLGHPSRNYYLGWSDWGNAEDTPVATSQPEP